MPTICWSDLAMLSRFQRLLSHSHRPAAPTPRELHPAKRTDGRGTKTVTSLDRRKRCTDLETRFLTNNAAVLCMSGWSVLFVFILPTMHRWNKRILAASGRSAPSPRESQRQNFWLIIFSMVLVTTVSSIFVLFYVGQSSQLLEAFKVENVQQLEMRNNPHATKLSSSKPDSSNITFESSVSLKSVIATATSNNLRISGDKNTPTKATEDFMKPPVIKTEPLVDMTSKQESGSALPLPLSLVSLNKPVKSDVRGNLGPATVVTNEKVEDWLQDRWQAARNMQGEPIPGVHWIEIDLEDIFSVEKILIDWEQAYSDHWSIMVRLKVDLPWKRLCMSKEATTIERNKMHVIQEVFLSKDVKLADVVRFVKLVIHRPSTMWGSSIWRFQIWGRPHTIE